MEVVKTPGVIATKLGMSSEFTDNGECIPFTYLQITENCKVIGTRTLNKDGYNAIIIGAGNITSKKLSKPLAGIFAKANLTPCAITKEFRVDEKQATKILPGTELKADNFIIGQQIDVTGKTIGKGFAGVMKRHNFSGLRATHGVSVSHRSHGSTGQRQDPGKVFKGKKMAGHLGDTQVTVKNLKIIGVDLRNNILKVQGAVPGKKGNTLIIKHTNTEH